VRRVVHGRQPVGKRHRDNFRICLEPALELADQRHHARRQIGIFAGHFVAVEVRAEREVRIGVERSAHTQLRQLLTRQRDRDRQSEHRQRDLEDDQRGPYTPDLHLRAAAADAAQCRLHPRPRGADRRQQPDDRGNPDGDQAV
jgi:murein L,D-transpeptidase YcbB/YkuD